ncbi:hypothetical protein HDV00_007214 [Rhizophlyctis rosea]|nr:hypothetical protein HDV00_007214 [Rhizophlyctis rosea]
MHLVKSLLCVAGALLAPQILAAPLHPTVDEPSTDTLLSIINATNTTFNPTIIPADRLPDINARQVKLTLSKRNIPASLQNLWKTRPPKRFTPRQNALMRRQLANPDSTPEWQVVPWMLDVRIGTGTNQTFRLLPNAATSTLWVRKINSQPNTSIRFFDPSASSTYKAVSGAPRKNVTYSIGSVEGILSTDTITVANLAVPKVTFDLVDRVSTTIDSSQTHYTPDAPTFDGIFPLLASRQSSFLGHLANYSMIPQAVFSLWFGHYDLTKSAASQTTAVAGELTYGGWSYGAYQGNVAWMVPAMALEPGYWMFILQTVKMDSTTISPSIWLVTVDPGSPGLVFSRPAYDQFNQTLSAKGINSDDIKCSLADTLPKLSFWFGGYAVFLAGRDYVTPYGTNGMCSIDVAPSAGE